MRYLQNITVKDFGGLESFSAEFGDCGIITGTNGKGKTSILSAVRSIFEGGGDTSLIRVGANKAEASIEFCNGYKAVKVIEPTKYSLIVTDANMGVIKSPASKLGEFVAKDTLSVQELLNADPKDLAALMLKYLPMTFTPEEVNKAIRTPTVKKPLSVIEFNALRQAKYDTRTNLNRDVANLKGSISNMRKALPNDDATDWTKERKGLDNAIGACDSELVVLKEGIDTQKLAFIEERRRGKDAEVEALRKQIAALESDFAKLTSDADKMAADEFATARLAVDQKRAALVEQRGAASAKADQQQQATGVRNAIAEEENRLEGHVSEETILSAVLEDMDKLKALKLKSLPVAGLDIEMDGKRPIIKINGIPLDRLNSQKQLYVLVQFISEAQAGAGVEFKVIVCEGAEMVPSKLIALGEACVEAGIQLIVTVPMEDQPLKVLTLEEYKSLVEVPA